MQSVSSRIWTRVAVSISYDDNDYTTGTSQKAALIIRELMLRGFELDHNAVEPIKNICYMKAEGADNHSIVTR